jgi:hypothetical protein
MLVAVPPLAISVVLSIAYGLLLGSTILVLQALLQPGHRPFRP